jgi:hypothetical protein
MLVLNWKTFCIFYNPSSRSTEFRIDGDTISGTNAQRNFTPFPKWSKEEKTKVKG